MSTALFFPLFFFICVASARLFTTPEQLTQTVYDFVVVGGGTAGNVIAERLSEDPSLSVLVIEVGIDNAGITEVMVPFLAPTVQLNASLIWNYTTVPQTGLHNRPVSYPRGRLLGGSSSINFLTYTRGSRDDFDRHARLTGDPGWSWDAIFPYMLKAEGFTSPMDNHSTQGQFDPRSHGFRGPLRTTLPNFPTRNEDRVIATTKADPDMFPFNLDVNSGNTVGVSWIQSTSGLGQRSSSATAYLQPALNRNNLDVLINTQVTRLLNIAHDCEEPDLRRVEFAQGPNGPRKTVRARKEVILSAGAVNTPQILLLSGVGDTDNLSALGIKTVVNSPGVGKNLQDHPLLANNWAVTSNNSLDDVFRNTTLQKQLLNQWTNTRTGLFSVAVTNLFAWLRLPPDSSIFNRFRDPTPGPTSGHVELILVSEFVSFGRPFPQNGSFFSTITNVVVPESRGSVKLMSTNPFDFPAIDPGFMSHPLDVAIMMEAVRTSSAFLATSPWRDMAPTPFGPLAHATTDEALEEYVRNEATTFWHPCGTAKMGTYQDRMAVVDPQLRLKGAVGVRVVDASVFPVIPSAHLQAAVYAFAERAADLIRHDLEIEKLIVNVE